ncbi:Hypothetical predicted protein [Paramuricea clavata]|uniref:Uncharacterized protein n=1 Tax=Paramuricea clavata TaxID=317549 RepID=A0A6S7GNB0_PARCT|nr:Hypothetical predicted protein [Paramuricea clavata]
MKVLGFQPPGRMRDDSRRVTNGLVLLYLGSLTTLTRGHLESYAELTPLGWVIPGPVPVSNGQEKSVLCVHVSDGEGDANRKLRKFWDVDSFGVRVEIKSPYTPGVQKALDILDESCKQQEFGYQLGLLWTTNLVYLIIMTLP